MVMQHYAFSVIIPFIWNSLLLQIWLLSKSYTPLLYKLLKTDLSHCGWECRVSLCSDAQNVQWWTEMCSDERLFLQWWITKKLKQQIFTS